MTHSFSHGHSSRTAQNPGPTRFPARSGTRSFAPPSMSSPTAASSTPRSPTSHARPASPPEPSTSTSAARTTCWSRSSSARCARRSPKCARRRPNRAIPSERLRRFARLHLARLGRDRNLADRLPGRAPAVHQVHGALLVHAAARLPRPHSRHDRRRPARAACFAPTSNRPSPRRCSSARSTRWRPTGS